MKILLLLPNIVLLIVSGYNLANDFSAVNEPNYLAFKILHTLVMIMCITFISLIVKSILSSAYVNAEEYEENHILQNENTLQHI